jgi:site-specific DNA-cytosine methylase
MLPEDDDQSDDEFTDEQASEEPRFTEDEVAAAEEQIVEQSKRIDFYITEYSVELLVNKMRNGRFGHPEQDRAITLREAAIIQTFPPQYRFLADGEVVRFSVMGRLIGNAVPVRLGEVIAASITRHVGMSVRSKESHERPCAVNGK